MSQAAAAAAGARVEAWGRLDCQPHAIVPLYDPVQAARAVRLALPGLAHGMGRSYGDQGLNPGGTLWMTRGLDRFIAFDPGTGELSCEAGVLLRDVQRVMRPQGWKLPVTPGTQLVTVGGAIANDIHGKNHHVRGTFGDHVAGIELLRTDGERIDCSREQAPDWFAATVGGMGLTGLVATARLRLARTAGPWMDVETLPFATVDEFFALADASERDWEHTVAWVDCIGPRRGRGIFTRAIEAADQSGAAPAPRRRAIPLVPPMSLVNGLSLRAFNALYFGLNRQRAGRSRQFVDAFAYPLDSIGNWNRMYGPRGFFQYQCVLPHAARGQVEAVLGEIARAGSGSFLAVLKTFGAATPPGMLSFPMHGVTLALDFPNAGDATTSLMARLDGIVGAAGGRLYNAKDARMPRAMFEAGYPRLGEFLPYRDPGISSAMSRRLLGN